jgi:hypothetical protein
MGKQNGNPASRYSRVGGDKRGTAQATWEDAEADALWRTIIAVTNAGDGITLSKTQDQGALSLIILSGTERIRYYPRTEEDIATLLQDIRISLDATD